MKIFPLFIVALLWACSSQFESDEVVAEAGHGTLTVGELLFRMPPLADSVLDKDQVQSAIGLWVDEQVLVEEARRLQIESDPEVAFLIEAVKRKILTDRVLQHYKSLRSDPKDGELIEYYQNNSEEFTRKQPLYKVDFLQAQNGKQAWKWREQLNKGTSFARLKELVFKEEEQSPAIDTGYVQLERIPECFHQDLTNGKPGSISLPRKCDGVYTILLFEDMLAAGSLIPFAEVRQSVLQRVLHRQHGAFTDSLITALKAQTAVFTYLDKIPLTKSQQTEAQTVIPPAPTPQSNALTPLTSESTVPTAVNNPVQSQSVQSVPSVAPTKSSKPISVPVPAAVPAAVPKAHTKKLPEKKSSEVSSKIQQVPSKPPQQESKNTPAVVKDTVPASQPEPKLQVAPKQNTPTPESAPASVAKPIPEAEPMPEPIKKPANELPNNNPEKPIQSETSEQGVNP